MTSKFEKISGCDAETVCELLDKLTVRQLHLMEEKMQCELKIESSMNNGTIHLAKSRYIMGQNSVSATRLPVENSPQFSASTICETTEDGVKQLKLVDDNSEGTVNPLHWFGVLVPQNLHKAQKIFQNVLSFVVECVNVQLQLYENAKNIEVLKRYKGILES